MGWLIFGIFIIYGWVEFEALLLVAEAIGGFASFFGIFVTALIGLSMLRNQLKSVMGTMRSQMARGQTGVSQLAASVSLLCGAILMVVPGYVTDTLGLLCFVPILRNFIGAYLLRHMAGRMMRWGTKSAFSNFNQAGSGQGFSNFNFDFNINQNTSAPSQDGLNDDINQAKHQQSPIGDDFIDGEFSEKSPTDKDR